MSEPVTDSPRLEASTRRVRVLFGGRVIADTTRAVRVFEPSLPPAWYIPPEDVTLDLLRPSDHHTVCGWKGVASYWSLVVGDRTSPDCAWSYPEPTPAFQPLRDYLAFYANRVDECYVDEERVQAQASDFYGGWVTEDVNLDRGDG